MPNPLSIITPALELLGKNINILPATRETAVSPPRVADYHAQCKNIAHLMLRQEVVDAVKQGKFHIYAVSTIDEGLEVLTDVPAGKKRKDGTYPKDSINYKVAKQLKEMAAKLRQFAEPEVKNKKKKV